MRNLRYKLKENEILKKGSISLSLQIVGSLIGYLFLILVTRNIGASSWGLFVLFLAVLNISSIFAKLGIDTLTIKLVSASEIFNNQVKKIYFSSFRLILLFSIIVSLILYATSDLIAIHVFSNQSYNTLIKWGTYILPIFALICLNENTFRGLRMIKEFAFFQRTARMLFAILLFVILYFIFNYKDSQIPILSYIIGLIIIFLITTVMIIKLFKSNRLSSFIGAKEMLKQSMPMMLSSSVLLLMSWTDSLMIGSFINEYQVGIYNVAVKIAMLTSFALNAVNSIAAPKLSKSFNNGKILEFKNIVQQTTRTIFYSTIPIILVICVFPKFLLGFFGEDFYLAKTALLILAFSNIINALSGSVGVILNMTGRERAFSNILVVALVINISLNMMLIPRYGIEGAAIASAVSLIFWNLYSVYYIYRNYGILTFMSYEKN